MQAAGKTRIESIDLLRGIVIILMALDHVRMYFGEGSLYAQPTDLDVTTPALFFTRWITHFCAPIFIFLAGTSAYLYGMGHTTRELSRYELRRGLWLVFVELLIVNLAWTFDMTFSFHFLQVIWAIGASMVILAGLVYLPMWAIAAFGVILVFGHNLLDPIQMSGTSPQALLWYLLHQNESVYFTPGFAVYFHYPLLPLTGLMALGYVFGALYRPEFGAERRRKWLLGMGGAAILLFVALRGFNLYGEPSPWSPQSTGIYTILSFLNTTKYPASLQFLLMTIGPALIFLALVEQVRSRATETILTYGRVSLFFYMVHIYLIHLLATLALVVAGGSWSGYVLTAEAFASQATAGFGFPLYVVYLVWALVMVLMYPACKWYRAYKRGHPEQRLLAYI